MKRTDLGWGGGSFDVLMNLGDGAELIPYCGSEEFHSRFGGKCYYTSVSGATGAGFMTAPLSVKKVSTYRVDTFIPWIGKEIKLGVGDLVVFAPIDYKTGQVPRDWPAIVARKSGWNNSLELPLLVHQYALRGALLSELEIEKSSRTTTVITGEGRSPIQFEMNFLAVKDSESFETKKVQAVLESWYAEKLAFEWGSEQHHTQNFWSRVGCQEGADNMLYGLRRGLCRFSVEKSALSSTDDLQKILASNCQALYASQQEEVNAWRGEYLYLQESDNGADAVYLTNRWENGEVVEELDFELTLTNPQIVRVLSGELEEILLLCREGVEEKRRQEAAHQAWQTEQNRTDAEAETLLGKWMESNGDRMVTIEDSVQAGNCLPGTESFRDANFPGKNSVTVAALTAHIGNPNVRRVLRQLMRSSSAIIVDELLS